MHHPGDTVTVRLEESGRRCACPKASVCSPRQEYEGARKDGSMRWDSEAGDEESDRPISMTSSPEASVSSWQEWAPGASSAKGKGSFREIPQRGPRTGWQERRSAHPHESQAADRGGRG